MAETTFSAQITNLVGGTIDQDACDSWAAEACKEIINQLPTKLKAKCATRSTLNDSATTLDLDSKGDILHVVRLSADSGGYQKPCREIPGMYGDLSNDSTDLNYYATVNDPVYWIASNSSGKPTLFVKPLPTANQPSYVHHITYPTVNVDASTLEIENFPDEATYLVILYTAIKQLHQYMNSKRSNLPSDLVVPVLESITESLPTWSAPDDFVVPVKPAVPTLSAQTLSAGGVFGANTAPTYTKPVLGLKAAPTISDLSISSVTPAVPSLSVQTVADFSSEAPTYVKPVRTSQTAFNDYWTLGDFGDNDPGTFSLNAVAPTVPSAPSYTTPDISSTTISTTLVSDLGTAPTYTAPLVTGDTQEITGTITAGAIAATDDFTNYMHWFDVLADMIETEEDIEMASVQLNKISTFLQSYGLAMQNQLNIFNDANVEYQAKIQEGIQQAQINATKAQGQAQISATEAQQEASLLLQKEQQEYSAKLQKYQAEVSTYQANANKEIQEYQQKFSRYSTELNTVYTAWAKTESDNIQAFSTDIQNELNKFNNENAIYQATIQEKVQEAQLSDANEARKLQKYQAEVATYSADVNKQVQEYQQNLTGDLQVWQTERQTDLQKYGSDMQNELNEFNKENASFQANMQESIQEAQLSDANEGRKLQKYQAEVGTYSAEVNTNVQTFTQTLTKNKAAFDTSMQKYTSEVGKVSASNASILQKFNGEVSDFSAKLQKQTTDYTWYQGQYTQLKADYAAGLAALKGTE